MEGAFLMGSLGLAGKHVFRVNARDRAGNLDTTPAVKRFKIKRP
jgi:hypothetical protein